MTAIVVELVLLALVMLTVTIVAAVIMRTTLDSCVGRQNVAVCVRHTRFVVIDALVAIFIIAGLLLL
jgi:hypothetical protein